MPLLYRLTVNAVMLRRDRLARKPKKKAKALEGVIQPSRALQGKACRGGIRGKGGRSWKRLFWGPYRGQRGGFKARWGTKKRSRCSASYCD